MISLRSVALGALLFVLGLLGYSWLVRVTDYDIYAYHQTEFAAPDQLLLPGSIAAVSSDGQISKICGLKVAGLNDPNDPEALKLESRKAIYYNRLREDFPAYVQSIRVAMGLFGEGAVEEQKLALVSAERPKTGREFEVGEMYIDNLATAREFAEEDCEKLIAQHLSWGYRVCTIKKALNTADLDSKGNVRFRTVAVAFAEHSNYVGRAFFERFDIAYTEAARQADGVRCDGDSLTVGAKLRRALDAIGRFSPPEQAEERAL